jgi:hypothetical protein
MKNNIFIPKKCKVGFNKREDTYTKKLGYIIYHDGKNWRKEPSWEGWREKYITKEDFDAKKLESFNIQSNHAIKYYNDYSKEPKVTGSYDRYSDLRDKTLEEYLKYRNLESLDKYSFTLRGYNSDITIQPIEFDNIPLEGFVLNRKAGGYSSGWNHRQTYCRVYDPRGFEFEITIPNLLYILEHSNSIKGKGLEGKFIYGWDGKDLVLVPEESPEYKEMVEYTNIQDLKVKKKDLVLGGIYLCSDNIQRTYLGESEFFDYKGRPHGKNLWWGKNKEDKYFDNNSINTIKKFIALNEDYSFFVDNLAKSENYRLRTISYEEVTETYLRTNLKIENVRYSYSYYDIELYILEGKKYRKCKVGYTLSKKYYIVIGRKEEKFDNIESLLKNYKLWQVKTTN